MAPYIRNKCHISVQDNSKGSSDDHFHAKVVVLDKANETESKLSPQPTSRSASNTVTRAI